MKLMTGLYGSTLGKKIPDGRHGHPALRFRGRPHGRKSAALSRSRDLNHYAHMLQSSGVLLWLIRAVLLFFVAVHIFVAVQLWLRNRRSRPDQVPGLQSTGGGLRGTDDGLERTDHRAVHHLPPGALHGRDPPHHDFIRGDVYHNVVSSFQIWWVAGFYIARQSPAGDPPLPRSVEPLSDLRLGPSTIRRGRAAGSPSLLRSLIGAGNISMPLAVLTGVVR